MWSKKHSYLNYYILIGFIFILLFRWILPLRLLPGRLTLIWKRVGQIEEKFLITYKVQTELQYATVGEGRMI
jgi:hypothetical protein